MKNSLTLTSQITTLMKFVKGKMIDDGEAWEVNQVSSSGRADPSRNNGACPLKMRGGDPSQGREHTTPKGTIPLAFVGAIAPTFLGGEAPLFYTRGHRLLGPRRGVVWLLLDKSTEVHGCVTMPRPPHAPPSNLRGLGV